MKLDYDLIAENISDFKSRFSFKEFLESYLAVKSRSFRIENKTAMVPYGDFLNHYNPAHAQWLYGIRDPNWSMAGLKSKEEYTKGFLFYSEEPIVKG